MPPKKSIPDYKAGPGGAMSVAAVEQASTPLLGSNVQRSNSPGAAEGSPAGAGKSMSLREQKAAKSKSPSSERRSPSPPKSSSRGEGCMPRGCRCDKICYLRMINYALDFLEGDTNDGLTSDGPRPRPNRARALCCCLLITVALILAVIFSWGYISGYVMGALGAAGSLVGQAFGMVGDAIAGLPSFNLSTLPKMLYDGLLGLFSSSWAGLVAFAGNSFTWFLNGGLLPHEIAQDPKASCMPWDSSCTPSKMALKAMADVETCPDGLVFSGGRATPAFGFSTLLVLFWLFYGVAIGADLFMEAIETITSQEVTTYVTIPGGGRRRPLTVKVWNATVANLTLMALGSSAPEILLSVIEICGNRFYSGELGPSTIVGSAAFNLMVISAVCVISIPGGEGRYIKQQSVFVVTAFFSVAAYIWLALILTYWSPNVITVTEGLVTLFAFPVLVYLSYLTDVGAVMSSASRGADGGGKAIAVSDGVSSSSRRRVEVVTVGGMQTALVHTAAYYRMNAIRAATGGADTETWKARKEEREAREKEERLASKAAGGAAHGNNNGNVKFAGSVESGDKAAKAEKGSGKKAGGKGVMAEEVAGGFMQATGASKARRDATVSGSTSTIEFGSTHFAARDGAGWVDVTIFRSGATTSSEGVGFAVAKGGGGEAAGAAEVEGRVTFEPTQQSATLHIQLLDDDTRHVPGDTSPPALSVTLKDPSRGATLGGRKSAIVRIVDGAAPGVLCLDEDSVRINESLHAAKLTLRREEGSHGVVSCTVNTKDGTAVAPADYVAIENQIVTFADGEVEKTVTVTVHNDDHFEGDETLLVTFTDATGGAKFSADCDGGPERAVATVTIVCDDIASAGACDAMLISLGINADLFAQVGLDWVHQLEDAIKFDGADCTWSAKGISAILFFLLAVPWRLAFALAPPPRLFGGWACFCIALVFIGMLTALVGDAAGNLGCCMGISQSVTAITFVALGTSLPDTFASMTAATSEPHADNSLGNITGSNSVNVFLGLGLPWAIAAIYWHVMGTGALEEEWRTRYADEPWYTQGMPVSFAVPAGSLGFSVIVFTGCALLTLGTLFARRAVLGFELGGPPVLAQATAVLFVALWLVYIILSIWQEGQVA